MKHWSWRVVAVVVALALGAGAAAQERTRESIPDEFKWDLTDLYPSDQAWREAKDTLAAELPKAAPFKGTLTGSPARLLEALELRTALGKELSRLAVYANLAADQDTRVSTYQGMVQEIRQLGSKFAAEWSFFEPELLSALDEATIDRFIAAEPRLKSYRLSLTDVLRQKPHTLTAREEELLALTGPMAGSAGAAASIFLSADLPYPTVTLADGKSVRLDASGFSAARASAVRDDRRKVMEAFFGTLGDYRRTLGTTMNGSVQAALFQTKARKYDSTLARALDEPNVPVSVYRALVEGVNRNLPAFHRYLALRKKMLGVNELHYYDLYAPLVADVPLEYDVAEARTHVKAAVAPLGDDYVQALDRAFTERWIDLYPSTGKQSGAYMAGAAYDVHPYLLLNYNGQYSDMSTLAHELGHAMHSWFSTRTQPFQTANYPIFVAEVASTFNEALLIDYMLKRITEPKARLSVLGNFLEGIKGTVFRQVQFAEFELRMHEMAQQGQPITGDALSKLYLELTRKYYGHDQGVTVVDDYVAHEWAFVPHFYRPFYVYQYATSYTASAALSENVLAGNPDAVKRFRTFIAAGGSKYPVDLLRDAGVDMTTTEPLDLTIRQMNRVMDEMEKLLAAPAESRP